MFQYSMGRKEYKGYLYIVIAKKCVIFTRGNNLD